MNIGIFDIIIGEISRISGKNIHEKTKRFRLVSGFLCILFINYWKREDAYDFSN